MKAQEANCSQEAWLWNYLDAIKIDIIVKIDQKLQEVKELCSEKHA